MATDPNDRFNDVLSFQTAIREYRSHAESITLASRAAEDMRRGQQHHDYNFFSRATYEIPRKRSRSWKGNQAAQQGLAETKVAHAESAYENGDFDLGLSILDPSNATHRADDSEIARRLAGTRAAAEPLGTVQTCGRRHVGVYPARRQHCVVSDQRPTQPGAAGTCEGCGKRERAITEKNRADAKTIEAERNANEAAKNADEAKTNAAIAKKNAKTAEAQKTPRKVKRGCASKNWPP